MNYSKRMLRILLVFSISMSVVTFITYARRGFDIDTFTIFLQLPKLNSANLNKVVYKDTINASLVESDHSNAMLLHVTTPLVEILKQRTTSANKQDIISTKTNSNTKISTGNLVSLRRMFLQRRLHDVINHDHWLYLQPNSGHFNKSVYDIMSMNPITFDSSYKNPCWRGGGRNGIFKDENLHCLPYFYLIGVRKSGTTDFMSRISQHPEYCQAPEKESQWLPRRRFGVRVTREMKSRFGRNGYDIRKVEAFSLIFDNATACIMSQPSKKHTSVTYRQVVADGSPSNFHMHSKWELLPGNENLTEPRFTNFHYIKHLTPDVKIIVLFRDPTTRLYSDFGQLTSGRYGRSTAAAFHGDVLKLISTYKSCFSRSTERSCVYSNTIKANMLKAGIESYGSFNAGFYAVFMEDMLSVFGKDRILPIFMPDYITRMEETLRNVFSFLDMTDVDEDTMFNILNSSKKNVGVNRYKMMPMLNATREILYDFFRPYNEQMAKLMNDSRYLFPPT